MKNMIMFPNAETPNEQLGITKIRADELVDQMVKLIKNANDNSTIGQTFAKIIEELAATPNEAVFLSQIYGLNNGVDMVMKRLIGSSINMIKGILSSVNDLVSGVGMQVESNINDVNIGDPRMVAKDNGKKIIN